MAVQTKITLTLEPHDLKIITEALILLTSKMEDAKERPQAYVDSSFDDGQLKMFANDAQMKAAEARAILNAIN